MAMLREDVGKAFPENCQPLCEDDQASYRALKDSIGRKSSKDSERHSLSFQNELRQIVAFVDQRLEDREKRALSTGFIHAGSFICVNTRQLKQFVGRCKSSINNGFQALGFVSVKTKAKARSCLLSVLPSLTDDPVQSRQWTVRCLVPPVHYYQVPARPVTYSRPATLPVPQINIPPIALPIPIINETPSSPEIELITTKNEDWAAGFEVPPIDPVFSMNRELDEEFSMNSFGIW